MSALDVQTWGDGVDCVLVHGSIATGAESWEAQRGLADAGFRLVVPDRRAYGAGAPQGAGEDFDVDADDVAPLLGEGAHLVGHSYGGVVALLAAARRPEAVLSLAVIEPPAFALRRDDPAVASFLAEVQPLLARDDLDDREFLVRFLGAVGAPVEEIPEELLDQWTRRVGPVRHSRPPWEAEIPLEQLAAQPFPKLVVSGGHHPAFDAVCDELSEAFRTEKAVVTGAGHEVQSVGEPFNEELLSLWRSARR